VSDVYQGKDNKNQREEGEREEENGERD